MKLTKRLVSMLLVLCMVFSMLPAVALFASAADSSATWTLVTDASTLNAGDVIILACDGKSTYAGAMGTAAYFSSKSTIADAIEITLGGASGAWTLTTSEGTIGTSAAKKLNCSGTGVTTWTIAITSAGVATIKSTTTSYGWIQYNASSPRFLNYASTQTNIQIYKKTTAAASYTVTPAANNSAYGSVSLSGSTITATPQTGYYVTGSYTVSPTGAVSVTYNDNNTFTVGTPTADCTVTINFAASPTYTLTLSENGSTSTFSNYAGVAVTLPSGSDVGDYTFLGWTASATVSAQPSDLMAADSSYTMPAGNTTLYAVYAKASGSGGTGTAGTYELVTSAPSDWAGDYVIANTTSAAYVLIADGSVTGSTYSTAASVKTLSAAGITLSGTTLTNVSDDYVFTISETASGSGYYYIKMKGASSDLYLIANSTTSSSSLSTATSTGTTARWTIGGLGSGGNAYLIGNSGRYLGWNSSYFRAYASSNKDTYKAYLFKSTGGGVSYSDWTTAPSGTATPTYTLTYNANTTDTVTGMPGAVADIPEGTVYTLSQEIPVRVGYTFMGWNTSASASTAMSTVTVNSDTTVYAIWQAKAQYTVSFYTKDGTTPVTVTYYDGDTIAAADIPAALEVEGFTFVGWYGATYSNTTAPTYVTPEGTTVTGNLEFHAVYAEAGEGGGETFKLGISGVYVGPQSGSNSYLGVASSADAAATFGIEEVDGSKYLYYLDGTDKVYVYNTGNDTSLHFGSFANADDYPWNVSDNGSTITFQLTSASSSSRYLGYNSSSTRFSTYDTSYPYQFTKIDAGGGIAGYTTNPVAVSSHIVTWYNGTTAFATTSVKENATIVAPVEIPGKADDGETYYTFAGWAATEGGEVLSTFGTMGTADMAFYAVFTEGTYTYTASISGSDGVRAGKTTTLTSALTSSPAKEDYSAYTASWSSSADSIATVNGGIVTGVAAGTADITVTYTDALDNVVATATKTITVREGVSTSGGYTLITPENAPDDFSGDYIIMGRIAGYSGYFNQFQIMTPYWIDSSTAIVEDGETNSVLSAATGSGSTVAGNNASEVTLTMSDGEATGTIADAYGYGSTITMESTGTNDFVGTDNNTYEIYDRVTEIDDNFVFTFELVDDINGYYTIRIKGTSYYLANTNVTTSGNNGMQYVLSASTDDTTALWYIRWATAEDGLTTNDTIGYTPDQILIESVYGVENGVSRAILFNNMQGNPSSSSLSNSRFRVYGENAYNANGNLGASPTDTNGAITYNLQLFGNPNPFNAQIYYQGDQKTIANPVELHQGMTIPADLESALVPDIADYPSWSVVGDAVWSISDDSSNRMTIDSSTGELLLNGATEGDYAIVTVTYTLHDAVNNTNHAISTQAKVVVTAPDVTYSTIIYETESGNNTEVQYTVSVGTQSLPLWAYVVNDTTGETNLSNSAITMDLTGASWTAASTNGYTVSVAADGTLDLSAVTGADIVLVTLTGVSVTNGSSTYTASEATYKVYVKDVAYTPAISNDVNDATGNFTAPYGSTDITLTHLVTNHAGETVDDGTYTLDYTNASWAITGGAGAHITADESKLFATLDLSGCEAGATISIRVSGVTATTVSLAGEDPITATVPNVTIQVTVGPQQTTTTDTVGPFTLMTQDNAPDDWSGDYVIMGRMSGNLADLNTYQVMTPKWTDGDAIVEDGNSINGSATQAQNNASIVSWTTTGSTYEGTITSAYTVNDPIEMIATGDNDFSTYTVLDKVTAIPETYVFTFELVDDINGYYTIRVKGTNYYLANTNTTASGNNGMQYVMDAATDDTTALWKLRWATAEDGLKTVDGYTPDVLLIESVYGLENGVSRAILFNTQDWGTTRPENSRFRVYGENAYADKIAAGSYGSGVCYNIYLFGSPNVFNAQIYYQGDQKTITNPVELNQGRTIPADLESALVPDIAEYPEWSITGTTWSIVNDDTLPANMTIDATTGEVMLNGAVEGDFAIVTVTYTIYNSVENYSTTVETQAKVVITAPDTTYSTIIYETVSGNDTEVQYTVNTDVASLPLAAYVVNDTTDEDSKTGDVTMGGTLTWTATSTNGYTVSISTDGVLDLSNVTDNDIILVTVSGATGNTVPASDASYKVYVVNKLQLRDDTATLADLNALTINVLANDSNLPENVVICGLGATVADVTANLVTSNVAIGTYGTVSVDSLNNVIFTPNATVEDGDEIVFYYSVQGEDGVYYYAKVTITVDGLTPDGSLVTDSLIIDFGIPVTFNPTANDTEEYANVGATGIMASASGTASSSVSLTEGTATVNADGTVTFTPTAIMTAPAVFYYTAEVEDVALVGTIQIIPATNVYYEDSMDGVFTFAPASAWATVGTTAEGAEQRADFVGDINSNVYGYDEAYSNFATYSMGSAHVATVDNTTALATVDFSFYGTGFDVVSLTGGNSGYIIVAVCEYGTTNVVSRYVVDTYYGFSYSEAGEPAYNSAGEPIYVYEEVGDGNGSYILTTGYEVPDGADVLESLDGNVYYYEHVGDGNGNYEIVPLVQNWIVDPEASQTFYQVPIMKVSDLPADMYTVSIAAYYSKYYDHAEDGSYEFVFDAVRVYDPCGNDETATNAYQQDGENEPHYLNLRDELVNNAPTESVTPTESSTEPGTEPSTEPGTGDYTGRYYIATNRSSGNYYYMTNDLGTASTKRYQAVDSGLTALPASITNAEANKIFVIEKNGDGTYRIYSEGITDSAKYLGWTSGNSGIFVDSDNAKNVTIADSATVTGAVTISFDTRYLSLNGTSGNDYFAWYTGTQRQDLVLIPVEGSAVEPDPSEPEEETYTASFTSPDADNTPAAITGTEITLPTMPTYTYDGVTYTFLGWVEETVDNVTTATTGLTGNVTLTEDVTYKALYTYGVTSGGSTGTTEAFGTGKSGSYVIAANVNGTYYAMPNTFASKINGAAITVTNGAVSAADAAPYLVTITHNSGKYTIASGSTYLTYSSSTNLGTSTSAYNWTIATGTHGSWRIASTATTTRGLVFRAGSYNQFGGYALSNVTAASTEYYDVEILPVASSGGSGSTTTTYYTTEIGTAAETSSYEVTITADSSNLLVGETTYATATLMLNGTTTTAYDSTVVWSSTNEDIFVVEETADNICVVKAVGAGKAMLRATFTTDKGEVTKGKYITVTAQTDATQPSSYDKTSNSGTRGVTCTSLSGTYADSYYTGSYAYENLSAQTGSTLLSTLRTMMSSGHTSTSYDDCKNYAAQTDCQANDGKVTLLYTGVEVDWNTSQNESGATTTAYWNREHVWPQSLGGFSTSGAGADLHHIRPDDWKTNNYRGNLLYGEVTGGSAATGSDLVNSMVGGYYGGSYFEPLDEVKGDVARICMYVYVRYGNTYTECSDITNVFESIDTLLAWHELDPVDTWEMGRNVVVEELQGNRNVFIDYPELAWNLFNKTMPSGYTTPSTGAATTSSAAAEYVPYDLGNTAPLATKAATREEGSANGIVFIDGNDAASLEEYEAHGPNNEIYLGRNQAVAFNLSFNTAPQSIQIGLKSVEGDETADKASWFVVSCGGNNKSFKITTATEMYYDITDIVTIGVTESGTYASASPVIITKTNGDLGSLTYLKWTSVASNTASRASAGTFLSYDDVDGILDRVNEIVGNTVSMDVELPNDPAASETEAPDAPSENEESAIVNGAERFTDLDTEAWYYDGVAYAVENGLMNGMSESEFMPNETVTRAMMVTMLYRMAGSPSSTKAAAELEDVALGDWYGSAIYWAKNEGIAQGITATTFGPERAVTREQMVTFLWRYAGEPESQQDLSAFDDADEISDYALTAMRWAVENGIINGDGTGISPRGQATRAQIASIFMRFEKMLALAD